MCYKDIIELLTNSIQIIGIFAAIIIGLVVSKILSIKAEQDDLKIKISGNYWWDNVFYFFKKRKIRLLFW